MIKYIYSHEGIGGFYKGVTINVVKVTHLNKPLHYYFYRYQWGWG